MSRDGPFDLLALRKQLVERHLADDIPQGGAGVLRDREMIVLHLDDGVGSAVYLEEQDPVDGDGHIVFRDDLLPGDLDRLHARVNPPELVDERRYEKHSAPADVAESAEAKDDRPLPLRRHPDRGGEDHISKQPDSSKNHRRNGVPQADGDDEGGADQQENDEDETR